MVRIGMLLSMRVEPLVVFELAAKNHWLGLEIRDHRTHWGAPFYEAEPLEVSWLSVPVGGWWPLTEPDTILPRSA